MGKEFVSYTDNDLCVYGFYFHGVRTVDMWDMWWGFLDVVLRGKRIYSGEPGEDGPEDSDFRSIKSWLMDEKLIPFEEEFYES